MGGQLHVMIETLIAIFQPLLLPVLIGAGVLAILGLVLEFYQGRKERSAWPYVLTGGLMALMIAVLAI